MRLFKKHLNRIICLIWAVAVVTAISACSSAGNDKYSVTYTDVFDTVTVFTAYCGSQKEFDDASERVHDELVRLYNMFNIYDEDSDISTLHKNGQLEIGEDIYKVLNTAISLYDETGGKLNIAMGTVFEIWHDFRESQSSDLPAKEELENAALHSNIKDIALSENSVSLKDTQLRLDFGAIVKGYAVDKAAEKAGLENFILNVGGNVVVRGEKPEGKAWKVGIENPEGGLVTAVEVKNTAVVTSGDYQRYRLMNGIRYHHIIDTETLYPVGTLRTDDPSAEKTVRSVSVIYHDSMIADALSTAIFCMEYSSGRALAEKYGAEVLWVFDDGSRERTGGFGEFEK